MITEIVELVIKSGSEPQFEADMKSAKIIISRAKGSKSIELMRSIENPENYRLLVSWETMDNNTVDFRQSPDYKEMGRLFRDHLANKPAVQHFNIITVS
jgi:heme-degrading monooxygenase HmoA